MFDDLKGLRDAQCEPRPSGEPPLTTEDTESCIKTLNNNWLLSEDGKSIKRIFKFKNYYETMAFANAAAQVAHQQDHHPEMTIGYNTCRIKYSTHSIDGLSINDFICAAKTDHVLSI